MAVPNVYINFWAVLVSAITAFIIGGLWYSPILFGNAWMKTGGMNAKDMEKAKNRGVGKLYFVSFLGGLLMAYILAHFVQYLSSSNFLEGMVAGCWLWLGFIVPVLLGSVLWEGKPLKFYLINVGYYLVSLTVMGGILAAWG